MAIFVRPSLVRHNMGLPAIDNTSPGSRLASLFGTPCPYCEETMWGEGSRYPTKDHVRPRSRGGKDSPKNIIIVCRRCNGDKDDMSLAEFHLALELAGDRRAGIIRAILARRGQPPGEAPVLSERGHRRVSRPLGQFLLIAQYLKTRKARAG